MICRHLILFDFLLCGVAIHQAHYLAADAPLAYHAGEVNRDGRLPDAIEKSPERQRRTAVGTFDEGAYKVRACYGRPLGAAPDNLYPAGTMLTPDEIDAVITYLQARVIGRGRITKEECLFYYSDRPDECDGR